MSDIDIKLIVHKVIMQVAAERSIEIHEINDSDSLIDDIGLRSLDMAAVVTLLEAELGVDPFEQEMAFITEIRTVVDLLDVYKKCLGQKGKH